MPRRTRTLIEIVLLAGIYFASGKLGLKYASFNPSSTVIWPPTGISLAAVLLLGLRITPGIFLGAFFVNIFTAGTVATSLGIAGGNTLEAVVGAVLVQHLSGGRNAFERARDAFGYLFLAATLATMLSPTIGVITLSLGGFARWNNFGSIWLTWWIGDVVSAAIVAPVIIIWAAKPVPKLKTEQLLEALSLLLLLIILAQGVFGGWLPSRGESYPLEWMVIPLLLWATFRFRSHGAVTSIAVLTAIAVGGTLRGLGPFDSENRHESLLLLQAFLGTAAVTVLVLAAVLAERDSLLARERAARSEAERVSGMKDEFLATLSHELRTPLTPALLAVSSMETRDDLPKQLRDDLRMIHRNIELESRLIEDLLDLTRISKGKMQLDFHTVDLHVLLKAAIDICRRENTAALKMKLNAEHHHVYGDAARLQQVFWNLIDNAQKFTDKTGTIQIATIDISDGGIEVEVRDTGIGIDSDLLPRLFNAFEQGEARARQQFRGLGLGLAISKRLVEAQHGTIDASSDGKGRGSCFSVRLRTVPPPPPSDELPRSAAKSESVVRSLNILLVEDDELTLSAMSKILRNMGHNVSAVATRSDALAASDEQRFDVLVSDLGLPDGSGIDLMRQLGDRYAGRAIALTGYGMEEDVRASLKAGFALHLTKPIDVRKLKAAIEEVAEASARAEPTSSDAHGNK